MKIYKFYKKPDKEHENMIIRNDYDLMTKYPLYALTNDKKLAKKFRKTRNMKMFLEKVDDMDNEQYVMFAKKHRGRVIVSTTLETVLDKNTENQKVAYATVIATDNELNYLMESIDTGQILNLVIQNWVPIQIFTEEVQSFLKDLLYDKVTAFIAASSTEDKYMVGDYEMIDLPIEFDQLYAFYIIYNDILTSGFFEEIKLETLDE